jgi:hypothetical protein
LTVANEQARHGAAVRIVDRARAALPGRENAAGRRRGARAQPGRRAGHELQDGYNLAWKLALVLRGIAGEALLDSYHAERHPIGVKLRKTTDRMFSVISGRGRLSRFARGRRTWPAGCSRAGRSAPGSSACYPSFG